MAVGSSRRRRASACRRWFSPRTRSRSFASTAYSRRACIIADRPPCAEERLDDERHRCQREADLDQAAEARRRRPGQRSWPGSAGAGGASVVRGVGQRIIKIPQLVTKYNPQLALYPHPDRKYKPVVPQPDGKYKSHRGTEMSDAVIVLTTWPAARDADELAQTLVGERLAACVNVLGEMRSTYRWKDAVEVETERQLIIKTTGRQLPALQQRLSALHPYELPEFWSCRWRAPARTTSPGCSRRRRRIPWTVGPLSRRDGGLKPRPTVLDRVQRLRRDPRSGRRCPRCRPRCGRGRR